jgi:hypothetical protein
MMINLGLFYRFRKRLGLPTRCDIGKRTTLIKKLKSRINIGLNITISDATLTTTHLETLYQDVGSAYENTRRMIRNVG